MDHTRRSAMVALPLLAVSRALQGQTGNNPSLASFAKRFEDLPSHPSGSNDFRPILNGKTASGDLLEVHETTLSAGASPHPPHSHPHEELFLMSRGQLEVTIAGRTTTIDAGGAAFVHSGELHGVRNPGAVPAQYFVIAIGA